VTSEKGASPYLARGSAHQGWVKFPEPTDLSRSFSIFDMVHLLLRVEDCGGRKSGGRHCWSLSVVMNFEGATESSTSAGCFILRATSNGPVTNPAEPSDWQYPRRRTPASIPPWSSMHCSFRFVRRNAMTLGATVRACCRGPGYVRELECRVWSIKCRLATCYWLRV
jgi:hypothetical protein